MKKVLSQCIVSDENPYISALHCKGVMSICMTPVWRTEKEFPNGTGLYSSSTSKIHLALADLLTQCTTYFLLVQ